MHLYIFKKDCTKTTVTCYNPFIKLRDNNEKRGSTSSEFRCILFGIFLNLISDRVLIYFKIVVARQKVFLEQHYKTSKL